jgi:2-deoxy-D-gluconate 3-dehydrogenase
MVNDRKYYPQKVTPEQKLPRLFDLTSRVAVVTGGAGLLGGEFCRTLVEAGAKVIIADVNQPAAKKLAAVIANNNNSASYTRDKPASEVQQLALPVETNVTDPASVQNMVSITLQTYGRLDILVNCAALDPKFDPNHAISRPLRADNHQSPVNGESELIESSQAFENFPLEAWNQALSVNLTGVFLCCQAVVKPMLLQGEGVIVNLSSIYGLVAPDQRLYQQSDRSSQYKPVYYSVTKFGVLGLTKYLATYYAGKNIRVNAISPGGVYYGHDDDFVKGYSTRTVLGRMAEKDEINGALLFLVSDASKYMTGANLVIDGGWTTW